MQTPVTLRISIDTLQKFTEEILIQAGASSQEASTVAESLVQSDAAGLFSHGTVRLLPVYVRRLRAGTTRPQAQPTVITQLGSVALVDGNAGLGQVAGCYAMDLAISMAETNGVGVVGVRNSSHFGASAFFAKRALKAGMIGMVTTNAPANMPPWGGRSPYFGTNPLCIALPCAEQEPVILDMSTSVVARGKIVLMSKTGETLPEGWAIDRDGQPTRDPDAALAGAVLPLGGYKGAGLALIIDALCGVLTGAAFGNRIVNLYDEGQAVQNLGHFFLALNPNAFQPAAEFRTRMDEFVIDVRAQPRQPGVDRILMPGELEHEQFERSHREGIALPDTMELDGLARELGVRPLHERV